MSRRGLPKTPDILTPREWQVLALVREGLSNREIAERLGISLSGAKHHVSEIITKLGVESREEAASWRGKTRRTWGLFPAIASIGLLKKAASAGLVVIALVSVFAFAVALAGGSGRQGGPALAEGGVATPTPAEAEPSATASLPATPADAARPSALPDVGHLVAGGTIVGMQPGSIQILDVQQRRTLTFAFDTGVQIIGPKGHTMVIDNDPSRLSAGDEVELGVFDGCDVQHPAICLTPRPLPTSGHIDTVLVSYFKWKAGIFVSKGNDHIDLRMRAGDGTTGGSYETIPTRIWIDRSARIEDDAQLPHAVTSIDQINPAPGREVYLEGFYAQDGALVAIWVQYVSR